MKGWVGSDGSMLILRRCFVRKGCNLGIGKFILDPVNSIR